MARIESTDAGLPMALNYGARQRFARSLHERTAPRAGFLSQLIAERNHMPTQRQKRQAPVAEVLSTYDAGGHIADRRLPPGYRMNVEI
jgi:hypothetical protein